MEYLTAIFDLFHHLPEHIAHWSDVMGPWVYVLLFCIIFAETGLVFTPFLPGDSLLFAAGALTAAGGPLDLTTLLVVLLGAAIFGDLLNYTIGGTFGRRLFQNPNSKLFSQKYLHRAEKFYVRHGGKAVVFARFLPIIRTYAPFVAGISQMPRRRYISFNILGATLWIWLFLWAGHWFGNLPAVKSRFQYVILAILVISVIPAVLEFIRTREGKEPKWKP
jgi:membrane-associated protein